MKAISLWQPWASAMALGLKRIETRHWSTNHRGLTAIHAAKRWTRDEREEAECFAEDYDVPALACPPLGAIVAIGELVDVQRSEELRAIISAQEGEFGNYGPGRFGWLFRSVTALPQPIPFKGAQGFFDVPDKIFGAPIPQSDIQCGCYRCTAERAKREPGELMFGQPVAMMRMFLCQTCGNKRCPHAADHRTLCTGSNEPGQRGSLYEDAPVPPRVPA